MSGFFERGMTGEEVKVASSKIIKPLRKEDAKKIIGEKIAVVKGKNKKEGRVSWGGWALPPKNP